MDQNQFSAAASALGYAYQFRYALALALDRLQTGLGWSVSIESADDVEVRTSGGSVQLSQLKHRARGTKLTDASTDLWKTLRIWSEAAADIALDLSGTSLVLVTTASIPEGSAAALLQDGLSRSSDDARAILDSVASTSRNQTLAPSFEAYLTLSPRRRSMLLNSVVVVGDAGDIAEVDRQLRKVCALAARREHVDRFVESLEGWWFRRCLEQLADSGGPGILAEDIEARWTDLREGFRSNDLPIDWDDLPGSVTASDFESYVFVRQLQLIAMSERRLSFAIRDYLRAFSQRSRWSRSGLLLAGELERYEQRLTEEWERVFERIRDRVSLPPVEAEMVEAGCDVYDHLDAADLRIRSECSEAFVMRGSYQMLADDTKIGWHPEYVQRLAALLVPVTAT